MKDSCRWRFGARADRPLVYAHRGARAHRPENTLEAFERAARDGADGLELDVRLTRDERVLVLHDRDFARVSGGDDGRFADAVDAREATSIALAGDVRAPLLDDVLDWLDRSAPSHLRLNVELKHDEPRHTTLALHVVALLRAFGRVRERTLVSSFHPSLLARTRAFDAALPCALLFHQGQRFATTSMPTWIRRSVGAEALHPERTLCSRATIDRWRSQGAIVNVWTVNDVGEARDLAALGVDGLIGDDPAALLATLTANARPAARD
jgi:glycerophosphoryl diester phosphodiesterase